MQFKIYLDHYRLNLAGKTAIVTGASRGLGPYIAKTLALKGVNIIALARDLKGLEKTKLDVQLTGQKCNVVSFDLTQINELDSLVNNICEEYGPIDILINNAGIENYQHFDHLTKNVLSDIISTNLRSPIELSRCLLPKMINQKSGHIINISSLAGKKGVAYNSVYSASKAGLLMWSDALRQEYKDSPIDISVICPGFVSDAGMFYDGKVTAPKLLGTSSPQKVANAVIKALRKGSCEIIVNSGPIRPLLALGQISWKLADKITRLFGVPALSRKRISA